MHVTLLEDYIEEILNNNVISRSTGEVHGKDVAVQRKLKLICFRLSRIN